MAVLAVENLLVRELFECRGGLPSNRPVARHQSSTIGLMELRETMELVKHVEGP
jgi:hypothetical protein